MRETTNFTPGIIPELVDKKEWHDHVRIQVAQAEYSGEPLSVAFIDIDHFKDINDTLGHAEGDKIITDIKHVVGFIANNLRTGEQNDNTPSLERRGDKSSVTGTTDVVAYGDSALQSSANKSIFVDPGHIGGDEFAILAKIDKAGAQSLAARIRRAFNAYIDLPENAKLKELGIGISIGVATFRFGMTAPELLHQADKNMYKNKLEQLPPLSEHQQKLLRLAKAAIAAADLRMRDLLKYEDLLN